MRTKNQKQKVHFEGLPGLPVEVSQNEIEPKDFLLRSLLTVSSILFVMLCAHRGMKDGY